MNATDNNNYSFKVNRVKLFLNITGIKETDMAKSLGVSRQTVNKWLTGKLLVSSIMREGICRYFNVPDKIFTQHEINIVLKGDELFIQD